MTVFDALDNTKLSKLSMSIFRNGITIVETLVQLPGGTWDLIINKPTRSVVEVNGVEHTYLFDSTAVMHDIDKLANAAEIKARDWSKIQHWNEATNDWEVVWEAPK